MQRIIGRIKKSAKDILTNTREKYLFLAYEILSNAVDKSLYLSRKFYSSQKLNYHNSDLGTVGGFPLEILNEENSVNLPPFSSLSWSDQQLMKEWRTIGDENIEYDDEESNFESAKRLYPRPLTPKAFENSGYCHK